MDRANEILTFWFGPTRPDGGGGGSQPRFDLWFGKDPQVDEAIRTRFMPDIEAAGSGRLDAWVGTARGRLALILLLDQFPRNVWRGSPRAFAYDAKALGLAWGGLAEGHDLRLKPFERAFMYMPLEHAEDPAAQEESVRAFERLARRVPAKLRPPIEGFVEYARRHAEIIDRFGRFPHRNAVLGRPTRPEEAHFLEQPGASF
jgi:uncharacterized protein (DUF924 family)